MPVVDSTTAAVSGEQMTPRQRILHHWGELKQERITWEDHWRDVAEHILPRRFRYLASTANRGERQNDSIINSTATQDSESCAAGMQGSLMAPSREWFKVTVVGRDEGVADRPSVKSWRFRVAQIIRDYLSRTNTYTAAAECFLDLVVQGTHLQVLEEDARDVMRFYVVPLGQYWLATDERGEVDTAYIQHNLTVRQVVRKFGEQNVSDRVLQLYRGRHLEQRVIVLHAIEPNDGPERGRRRGWRGMPWRSCWLEVEREEDGRIGFLHEGGYEEFPCMAPRWSSEDGDIYGRSPGMKVLGDVHALQQLEIESAVLIQKSGNPPMKGSEELLNQRVSLLPGDFTAVPAGAGGGEKFEPSMQVQPAAIEQTERKISKHEARIHRAFYVDLWMSILADDRAQRATAEEIRAKKDERLLQLGRVVLGVEREYLAPLVKRAFGILWRRGLIPPPPPELQQLQANSPSDVLDVEFESIMTAAQKMLELAGADRLVSFVLNMAQGGLQGALRKLDVSKVVDFVAATVGARPELVVSDEDFAAMEAAQAKQQQVAQAGMVADQTGRTVRDLASADTGGKNALTDILAQLSPVAGTAQVAVPGGPTQ